MISKPYFNGSVWCCNELGAGGVVIQRHKFNTEQQAIQFYNKQIDQLKLKPKGQEDKILKRSQAENKGHN